MKFLISRSDRERLLRAALSLVDGCRKLILRKTAAGFRVRRKADQSFVTDADTAAERFLRAGITRRFPDHGILGEEFPPRNPRSDFQWILDPIDGTHSFTRGIPLYGTIVSLQHRGKPVLGVIDHPGLGRRYHAAAGLGSWCGKRRLRVSDLGPDEPLEGEIIATGDRAHFIKSDKQDAFDRLLSTHPLVRTYSDCFGHTLAAEGAVGAMVEFGLRIWDISASQLLIEEAGGKYVCAQKLEKPGLGTLYGVILGKPKAVDWLLGIFD